MKIINGYLTNNGLKYSEMNKVSRLIFAIKIKEIKHKYYGKRIKSKRQNI